MKISSLTIPRVLFSLVFGLFIALAMILGASLANAEGVSGPWNQEDHGLQGRPPKEVSDLRRSGEGFGSQGSTTRPRPKASSTLERDRFEKRFGSTTASTTRREIDDDHRYGSSTSERIKEAREKFKENENHTKILRAKAFLQRTLIRFHAAINRLGELANRLESRIAKLDQSGVNTTNAKALLVTAKTKIATASSTVDAIATTINLSLSTSTASSTDPRSTIAGITDAFKGAERALQDAQRALSEVTRSLKPGRNASSTQATSTDH